MIYRTTIDFFPSMVLIKKHICTCAGIFMKCFKSVAPQKQNLANYALITKLSVSTMQFKYYSCKPSICRYGSILLSSSFLCHFYALWYFTLATMQSQRYVLLFPSFSPPCCLCYYIWCILHCTIYNNAPRSPILLQSCPKFRYKWWLH